MMPGLHVLHDVVFTQLPDIRSHVQYYAVLVNHI